MYISVVLQGLWPIRKVFSSSESIFQPIWLYYQNAAIACKDNELKPISNGFEQKSLNHNNSGEVGMTGSRSNFFVGALKRLERYFEILN